ncbi:16S rRNA (guanine(527)-N(7))-methyltransferase RsmG [Sulfitobacter sp. KE29]|uniref:16S rRNA (guanine(527)-N(7))-methyltransferase RsmG n=1 Tax=unclassified Sulfitobacter TaxID=196795 RepID=UPI0007C32D21|nr:MULTISPECIES: 16S rRNA (guanine(527)-N(7))-methyltransferase RsmG [unclassified Sulfitobacter]KZY49474.1 16S rRNA (guanine(527)-N(7))-methyltransferase RsmG [Sulfitobacter sp. HI0054]MBO9439271.1 16S rRNA (guanine(527)-N(7))-methyltransferase RsmG [Sulfitobacter sp. R18_2]MDF3417466.1 16S rRNA (guanine(527)-N(7))-methyltransferase RsmG [Sulfitobacter sp. Ks38]MDF3424948.1 16S rRNA (guanine(527)-N(7))-methyltransferase RsmG [Sulfitobacter sp. KE29]MDF3428529.1 16S rRNA (guanine(527)-N(7))-me
MSELRKLDVSRETFEKLEAFGELVRKWNPRINLVSKSSLEDLWTRHILDSVQVFNLAEGSGVWVDLGSGGGFPGIVVSILNQEERHFDVTLVESDQRKCAFLRTAIRELTLEASVKNERIEEVKSLNADVLSARALADLTKLLGFAELHLKPEGTALFPKGQSWQREGEEARLSWMYGLEPVPSQTNPEAAILKIKDIARV